MSGGFRGEGPLISLLLFVYLRFFPQRNIYIIDEENLKKYGLPKLTCKEVNLPNDLFYAFLSHAKPTGVKVCESIKNYLKENIEEWYGEIFYDVDNLNSISYESLVVAIRESCVFVVILSKEYFSRVWCLLECYIALKLNKPIVTIRPLFNDKNKLFNFEEQKDFLLNLDKHLDELKLLGLTII